MHLLQEHMVVPYSLAVSYQTGNIITDLDDGMGFYASLLPTLLRLAPNTPKDILKQRDGGGIHNVKSFHVCVAQLAVR